MKQRMATEGWQDVVELLIAVWLCASPFVLGYISNGMATTGALMIGTLLLLTSQLGIAEQQLWEEWVNLILASILIISPWLLGYADQGTATVNALACGVLLISFAVLSMKHEYDREFGQPTLPTT